MGRRQIPLKQGIWPVVLNLELDDMLEASMQIGMGKLLSEPWPRAVAGVCPKVSRGSIVTARFPLQRNLERRNQEKEATVVVP